LIIGTYRPVDVIVQEHPLKAVKQELQLHGQCQEVAVRLLSEEAVAAYLTARVQADGGANDDSPLQPLAHAIYQRTEGNPLFMVSVVDEMLAQETIDAMAIEASTPPSIRQMIEQQLERLSIEEQRVLEVASVAGMEFSAAAVAAGLEGTVDGVEERYAALVRRGQFLQSRGTAEWPDGTITTRYSFLHALYQGVIYERIPTGRCINLHQRLGERLETAYGERAKEIAAELAVHFERGRDYARAVQHLQHAGQNAMRRSAQREAISHLTKGLELLKRLPDTPERAQNEVALQIILGPALIATKGYAAPEVAQAYTRARELCHQLGEGARLFTVLRGLWVFYFVRGELETARELGEQLLRQAQNLHDSAFLLEAYRALGATLGPLGKLTAARVHIEHGIALYNLQQHGSHAFTYGEDPGVSCLSWAALVLELLGYPDQALKRMHEALSLAQELSHPHSLVFALFYAAWVHLLRREERAARERIESLIALADEQGFSYWVKYAAVLRGWALAKQGQEEDGITQMHQGLAVRRATGAKSAEQVFLAKLADISKQVGRVEEGLNLLAEVLVTVDSTGERIWEAELYRLKGELLLAQEMKSQKSKGKSQKSKIPSLQPLTATTPLEAEREAEECFLKAIDIARRQQAKSWELRASTSLARLWQSQGKRKKAHRLLAGIYGWFTEGFDTKDLQEAKALLDDLSR
jgi:predicted ATPase